MASDPMRIGNGVEMNHSQYLAGFKEEKVVSYPTVARPPIQVPFTIDGNIDDLFAKYPDLERCLYNDVKMCSCGKPCAFTMTTCNSCGKPLPDVISKSENVFSAFLFGVKLAVKGFPYVISLRRETDDVLIFDDMLQLCPCHLNGIPKKYYIPDWRFLLLAPRKGLEVLDMMEAELWEATKTFLQDAKFRQGIYRPGVTDEYIQQNIVKSFNFPPSQFQMHVQWLVPPLTPFQHLMQLQRNHFHEGRAFPLSYVRNVLKLDKRYDVTKDTPIEDIIEFYKGHGVDYTKEWSVWYHQVCIAGTDATQNWNADDYKYVVQDGKVHNFSVSDGKIQLGAEVPDVDPTKVQTADKAILQNYGRPYSEAGKPSGTYIQKPLQPKWGDGGYLAWPPA